MRFSRYSRIAFALMLGFTMLSSFGTVRASEAAHPAHIHAGTCAELGDVVAPLSDIDYSYNVDGAPAAMGGFVGQSTAVPAMVSVTTVPLPLADIIAGGHAINVHKSADEIGEYIACGDIGGIMLGESDLPIVLSELNNSGYSGMAHLTDNGDGTTTVTVYLSMSSQEEEAMATPAAESSPAAVEATGRAVSVILGDFFIRTGNPVLKAGETYTFVATNTGQAVHELIIEPAGALDEPLEANGMESEIEDILPGTTQSITWTFDEPGEYQLSCHLPGHFEAGMVVTFVVE